MFCPCKLEWDGLISRPTGQTSRLIRVRRDGTWTNSVPTRHSSLLDAGRAGYAVVVTAKSLCDVTKGNL